MMRLRNIYSVYVFVWLTLTGIWSQLCRVSILVSILQFAVLVWAVYEGDEEGVLFLRPKVPLAGAILLGFGIWLPVLLYFGNTYHQEFPFYGDHVHHIASAWNALLFWKDYGSLWFAFVISFGLFYWKWRKPYWPLAALIICYLLSLKIQIYQPFSRYPAAFYALASPVQWLFERLGWPDALNANRWVTVLSIGVWCLGLRPLLLGRWPDAVVFLVGSFWFFQKDVIYYSTTTYLDVSAVCLVLLGLEAAWTEREKRPWLGVLICGLAAAFKEQAIFAVPVAWVAAYGVTFRRKSLLSAVVAVVPFLAFWAFHSEMGDRPLKLNLQDRFSGPRFEMYLARLIAEFRWTGVLCILLLVGLLAFHAVGTRKCRLPLVAALGAALAIELITFVDLPASPWTGYPRYHFIPLAILSLGLFILGHNWIQQKSRLWALGMGVAVLQLVATVPSLRFELEADYHRNFVEHFDAPLFFPIRGLVEKAENVGLIHPGEILRIQDPLPSPNYDGWLETGYRDLASRYRIQVDKEYLQADCRCTSEVPNFMVLLVYHSAGIYRSILAAHWVGKDFSACAAAVETSCSHLVRIESREGILLGVLGSGVKAAIPD